MASSNENEQQEEPWFLKSTFPVFFPHHCALTISQRDFLAFLREDVKKNGVAKPAEGEDASKDQTKVDPDTTVISDTSTAADVRENFVNMTIENADTHMVDTPKGVAETGTAEGADKKKPESDHPFMQGLLSYNDGSKYEQVRDLENKMLTENADLAHRSTGKALVDLFAELEDVVSGPRLLELLDLAWKEDPVSTLKIIFNARSIHLGKASRQTFYRCAGWLATYHPLTLIANLSWLSRPVIQKKMEKKGDEKGDEDDMVFVEEEMAEDDPTRFDVKNGVAHGYWKDLLNLLVLQVNGKLHVLANPRDILNTERQIDKKKWPKNQETAKTLRHEKRGASHEAAIKAFNEDPVYRALHLSVVRLFAAELKKDLGLLQSKDPSAKKAVSLCAKWAPSAARFHDKHTFIVSSIAEAMYPPSTLKDFSDYDEIDIQKRELYLRHARELYRKDVAALRKHLECVERDITTNSFEKIKYDRVPSVAMNTYAPLFAKKDTARFEKYIDKVASGKAKISGATLLPSTLIKAARDTQFSIGNCDFQAMAEKRTGSKDFVGAKMGEIKAKVVDGQWKTLVQRIKDSGSLENCIAVADVSGSMKWPTFPDGTCPLDSSIGLSLLIAEVTKPPFGGAFITFSTDPEVQRVDLSMGLHDKYDMMSQAHWAMSTDFVAVFERLILPMAVENKLAPEDMVKRVFVFSDMQFNTAGGRAGAAAWSTSYERIQDKFRGAGYDMPELVFWNLAGGRAGYMGGSSDEDDPVAPKPVTAADAGTALVSGYSQGMLKVFLSGGSFEDEDAEEEVVVEEVAGEVDSDGEVVVEVRKKQKLDPLSVVKRAIGHPAYSMLQVVD